jgi:homospermidine synthase
MNAYQRIARDLAAGLRPTLGRQEVIAYLNELAAESCAVDAAVLEAAAWLLENPTQGYARPGCDEGAAA